MRLASETRRRERRRARLYAALQLHRKFLGNLMLLDSILGIWCGLKKTIISHIIKVYGWKRPQTMNGVRKKTLAECQSPVLNFQKMTLIHTEHVYIH